MRKIISIVMLMFITIGIVPASASSRLSEEHKTAIEKNLKDGVLNTNVIMKLGNYYKINKDNYFQMARKLETIIESLVSDKANVLLKVEDGVLHVIEDNDTLTGDLVDNTYTLNIVDNKLISLISMGPTTDTADLATRLTYGIVKLTNIGGEIVNYRGSFYPPNNASSFSASYVATPSMTMTLENKDYSLNIPTAVAQVPVAFITNLSKINVDVTCESVKSETGEELNINKEFTAQGRIYHGYNSDYIYGTYKDGTSRITTTTPGKMDQIWVNRSSSLKESMLPVGKTFFNYSVVMSPGDI